MLDDQVFAWEVSPFDLSPLVDISTSPVVEILVAALTTNNNEDNNNDKDKGYRYEDVLGVSYTR